MSFKNIFAKKVCAKMFCSIDVFKLLLRTENELLVSLRNEKKLGVTNFVSEVKGVENKFEFEKLVSVNQHGLRRFTLKI